MYELKYKLKGFDQPHVTGNNTGIVLVAGWTPVDRLTKYSSLVECIGSLYSTGTGVELLEKNLLYNNHVHTVVFLRATRQDRLSDSIDSAVSLIKDTIPNLQLVIVDDLSVLETRLKFCYYYPPTPKIRARIVSEPIKMTSGQNDKVELVNSTRITGGTLEQIHNEYCNLIKLQGVPKSEGCLSIFNAQIHLPQEVVNRVNFTEDDRIAITEKSDLSVSYTYGDRLYPGLERVVSKFISTRKSTRSAYASTWLHSDFLSKNPPCLVSVQFNIYNETLFLSANFRSQDAFQALIGNVKQLTALLSFVAEKVGVKSGSITINVADAHIYNHCLSKVQSYRYGLKLCPSPFSFVRAKDDLFVFKDGGVCDTISIKQFSNVDKVIDYVAMNYPSLSRHHYIYLGTLLYGF